MVILTCYVSCTIRRCNPTTSSEPYYNAMSQFMEQVVRTADANIMSKKKDSRVRPSDYEDKLLVMTYTIVSKSSKHATASEKLVTAFSDVIRDLGASDTSYYLSIESVAKEEDLLTYFYGIPLQTFSLGYMSNAVRFHTQFDYGRELSDITEQDPTASIEIDDQRILIDFAVSQGQKFVRPTTVGGTADKTEVYRLAIDFKHLSSRLLVNSTPTTVDLCFLTSTPLQLWRTQRDETNMSRLNYEKTTWVRTCRIRSGSELANMVSFDKETLGGCHAVVLKFDRGPDIWSIVDSLYHWGDFEVYCVVLNYLDKTKDFPSEPTYGVHENGMRIVDRQIFDEIDWMLAAIHSIGYRVQHQLQEPSVSTEFFGMVSRYLISTRDDRKHLSNALSRAYDVLLYDADRFLQIDRVLKHFLRKPEELDELVMTNTRLVKRLIITPSRVILQAPCLMHDNRILREFDADSAVSVSYQNDDMSGFGGMPNSLDFVGEAVGEVLENGITVAKRHYQFLGCSGSQMRSNGCWFYAQDRNGKTAEDIRKWMGDLDHIRNPGTYLSRMGQCFSDTTAADLDKDIKIKWDDPDIEGGMDTQGKPYCFSDGVGRISEECLKVVFMNLNDQDQLPSAFQVRLGGCKGMLTLDKNLTGKTIMVRKSMFKFDCDHTKKIDVMRRTQPTPLFLNHQVITILSQLRTPIQDFVFIRFQNTMLHKLADVLLDDKKALLALNQGGFSCCYSKLAKAGMNFTTDPFFKGVLKAITCARINNVKLKTRIEIPAEYGRNMLGVMDEVGVLEYGEVFIQYSADIKSPKARPIVVRGNVVVSKMPALHPGDVRKLKAVDRPELRHLVDCIVFPRKGPRPHPNEMAGSDLDGDEYFVTWHPDLIFDGDNEIPMDFPSIRKNQQDRPITVKDMVDFIVTYITNDKVGTISNAHLAWADTEGIYSDRCKELARIFCHVIDFNKTGFLPDEVKGKNLMELLPKEYPDFMGKEDHKDTYKSDNVLGSMYRISKRLEQAVTTIDKEDTDRINEGSNWTIDERFLIRGHEDFLDEAEKLYGVYADYLDTEQRRYGIESEEELVSGCVIKIEGMYSRQSEVYDTGKRLRERMKEVSKHMLRKFDQVLERSSSTDLVKRRKEMMLAAACYVITYRDKRKHRSFPWVFADTLLQILQRTDAPGPDPPLDVLTKSIDAMLMEDVKWTFQELEIAGVIPADNRQARIYYILINWGQKSKFLPSDNSTEQDTIPVGDFVAILNATFRTSEEVVRLKYSDTGPLLCAVLRAITKVSDNLRIRTRALSKTAVANMKRQFLLGHHQLARSPTAECLMIRKERKISSKIIVPVVRWDKIKQDTERLRQTYLEQYRVLVNFRRRKKGGQILIKGEESNVFNFTEFWMDKAPN